MAASFQLRITKQSQTLVKNGGVPVILTLVDLTDTSKYLITGSYQMRAKAPNVLTTDEQIEIVVIGATYAAARANLNTLINAMSEVQKFWNQPGYGNEAVYLEAKVESTDGWYRSLLHPESEITDIDVDLANRNAKIPCRFNLRRDNFWEGTEVDLPVTNDNPNNVVYLTNDGVDHAGINKVYNWLTYAAQTGFDLPSPLQLQFYGIGETTETFIDAVHITDFKISKTIEAGFKYYFEGEDGVSGAGSAVDLASCSGGKAVRLTINFSKDVSWALKSVRPDIFTGRTIVPIIRVNNPAQLEFVEARFGIFMANTEYFTEWQTLNKLRKVQRMQGLQFPTIPDNLFYTTFLTVGAIKIYFRGTTGSDITIDLDYLQLFFADTMVTLSRGIAKKIAVNETFKLYVTPYDDYCDGFLLINEAGDDKYAGNFINIGGNHLMIEPGVAGYLAFAWEADNYGGRYERMRVAEAKYRPRRLSF